MRVSTVPTAMPMATPANLTPPTTSAPPVDLDALTADVPLRNVYNNYSTSPADKYFTQAPAPGPLVQDLLGDPTQPKDLQSFGVTPYAGLQTRHAVMWHSHLVANLTEMEKTYQLVKPFGANATMSLEDAQKVLAKSGQGRQAEGAKEVSQGKALLAAGGVSLAAGIATAAWGLLNNNGWGWCGVPVGIAGIAGLNFGSGALSSGKDAIVLGKQESHLSTLAASWSKILA